MIWSTRVEIEGNARGNDAHEGKTGKQYSVDCKQPTVRGPDNIERQIWVRSLTFRADPSILLGNTSKVEIEFHQHQ